MKKVSVSLLAGLTIAWIFYLFLHHQNQPTLFELSIGNSISGLQKKNEIWTEIGYSTARILETADED